MNMKYMALFSLLFATGINSMSPIDRYENARKQLRECKDSWGAFLIYGCNEQMAAFEKEKNYIIRPFKEMIKKTKESDKVLKQAVLQSDDFLDSSFRKQYKKEEKIHGLNSIRHHIAGNVKRCIEGDAYAAGAWTELGRSDYLINNHNRSSIEKAMIERIKSGGFPPKHIRLFSRPKNAKFTNQAREEIKKEIDQLQTKDTI